MIIYRSVFRGPPLTTKINQVSSGNAKLSSCYRTDALQSKQVCGEENCKRAIHDCYAVIMFVRVRLPKKIRKKMMTFSKIAAVKIGPRVSGKKAA